MFFSTISSYYKKSADLKPGDNIKVGMKGRTLQFTIVVTILSLNSMQT